MKRIAIVLASGSGRRFGKQPRRADDSDLPKQFLPLAGKPILLHSLKAFEASPLIDELLVVVQRQYLEMAKDLIAAEDIQKPVALIAGGRERYDSSYAGVLAIEAEEAHVLIHDAARPLVSQAIIERCVFALNTFSAACPAIACSDTIATVVQGPAGTELLAGSLERAALRQMQTPQAFSKSLLLKAFGLFWADPARQATDDAGIVLRYLPEQRIAIVPGEASNLKITHPHDLALAELLLNTPPEGFIGRVQGP